MVCSGCGAENPERARFCLEALEQATALYERKRHLVGVARARALIGAARADV